jgi:hypothetical protein
MERQTPIGNLLPDLRRMQIGVRGKRPTLRTVNTVLVALKSGRCIQGNFNRRQAPDVSTLKIVVPESRLLLVTIPKAGTKSVEKLFPQTAHPNRQYVNRRISLSRLVAENAEYGSYFKASFVRNPWDRVASCYLNKVAGKPHMANLAILSRYSGLWFGMPFEAFVEWLVSPAGSDGCADRHWISQYRILSDSDADPEYDFIGRFEKIREDWARLCDTLDLPVWVRALPHSNKSAGLSSYASLFNKRTARMVRERYERDIDLFEYRFGAESRG